MSQRGWLSDDVLARRMPESKLIHNGIEFSTRPEADADVIVIQNYLRYDSVLTARDGFIWKWDNEPIVNDSIHRGYDRVFTHLLIDDPLVTTAPPILDWWIGKTYDELRDLTLPDKTRELSAIASTKDWITGHRVRGEFVERVAREFPEVDIFGRGRNEELDDKWDGLAPYRYSLAIENTSKNDYWTEKISDCFLSYTVPMYFGATNISRYFPKNSYIWLPLDEPREALRIIRDTFERDDWNSRLPALQEARGLVLDKYSLFAQITGLVHQNYDAILASPKTSRRIKGRRTRPGGWLRGAGLRGNLRAQIVRRQARRKHY